MLPRRMAELCVLGSPPGAGSAKQQRMELEAEYEAGFKEVKGLLCEGW